jgi:hypothetical protein
MCTDNGVYLLCLMSHVKQLFVQVFSIAVYCKMIKTIYGGGFMKECILKMTEVLFLWGKKATI